jgi:transposase
VTYHRDLNGAINIFEKGLVQLLLLHDPESGARMPVGLRLLIRTHTIALCREDLEAEPLWPVLGFDAMPEC